MKYRIGLDIGVASVGWSAMECDDETGEPVRIADLGVRIFDAAEQPKTGESLAAPRRTARGLRRRLRRRAHRLERVRFLCVNEFGEDIIKRAEQNSDDIFRLRYIGLSEKLKDEELTRLLVYFAKHRGFKSNRKSEKKDKEAGKILEGADKNSGLMKERGYQTIGEMIYRDKNFFSLREDGKRVYQTRNGDNDYSKTFLRVDLEKEISIILNKQKEFALVDDEFVLKYLDIFSSQRSFDEGPAKPSPYRIEGYEVGKCIFEKDEDRAPKASYTFEYFSALQKINNLKIVSSGTERFLTVEERKSLKDAAKTKKGYTFDSVRKLLNIQPDEVFNLVNYSRKEEKTAEETEKKTYLFKMDRSYDIRKALNEERKTDEKLIDEIGNILSRYKSDERRLDAFTKSEICGGLSDEEKNKLLELNFSTFGSLSFKAMRKIIPELEDGKKYNEACEAAGYDFRAHKTDGEKLKTLKGEAIKDEIDSIMNPVVRRAIAQTVKVLNAIIIKYGSPCAVNIELARELAKNFSERQQIKKDNETREADYQKYRNRLRDEFHITDPKGIDVLKLRLYEDQGGKCAYSQKAILTDRLFEPNEFQIDHIIPYSRSFDDSYSNKVLVYTSENQNKRNCTPFEYMGENKEKWAEFESFVNAVYNTKYSKKKKENLLRRSFTEDNEKEWKSRNLNDTRYITRIIYNLIKDYLLFDPIEGKINQVIAVNGKITSDLRKLWGLNKVREDGDKHHALDACVIACTTDGMIRRLTEYSKSKERYFNKLKQAKRVFYENGERMFIDEDGVVVSEKEFDARYCREKEPYGGFKNEVEFRLMENPSVYADENYALLQRLGYSNPEIDDIQPVFVSRMPKRKAKGAIHDETLRSAREKDNGIAVGKTSLTKLKLKNGEIENYNEQAKKDDRLLYEALRDRLKEFDGKADMAFAEPFYKPTSNGEKGNVVKKVLINNVFNTGVFMEKRNVIADNGSMVRVDVFIKDGKYYCVPVYMKDVYAQKLPNKAVTAGKKYKDWDEIDGSYEFKFSLFYNDLIHIKSQKAFNLEPSNSKEKQKKEQNEGFFYYKGIDISTGCSTIITHDNGYKTRVGLKTLLCLQKYTVDILGEKKLVKSEKRMPLTFKKK